MGAEIGATTSIFPYDYNMSKYLKATARQKLATLADTILPYLSADKEVYNNPEKFYDDEPQEFVESVEKLSKILEDCKNYSYDTFNKMANSNQLQHNFTSFFVNINGTY